jgi:hypothetical protein
MAASMNTSACWDIEKCSLVEVDRPLRCAIALMSVIWTSETSFYFYKSTWRYIPKGCHIQWRSFKLDWIIVVVTRSLVPRLYKPGVIRESDDNISIWHNEMRPGNESGSLPLTIPARLYELDGEDSCFAFHGKRIRFSAQGWLSWFFCAFPTIRPCE